MQYFGFFKALNELNIPNSVSYDLYEKALAKYYDKMLGNSVYDIEVYLKNAYIHGDSILELACGSGRLTIPIAKRGFQITGIDLSADMLEILKEKLEKNSMRVREKITLHQYDMTDFALSQKFSLVILPATSISLLLKDEQIQSLFRCVYNHLEKGGRFVFDYRIADYVINNPDFGKPHFYTWNHDDYTKEFLLFAEDLCLAEYQTKVNFYAELIENTTTKRFFGSSTKRLINDGIIDMARSENFELVDTYIQELSKYEVVKYVTLERQ